MRGFYPYPDPNKFASDTWEGKAVALNGSDKVAVVLRAWWQGWGKAVQLRVSVAGAEPFITDSEHATIVKGD